VRWSRPKSGMKNCNLSNRIVPQVFQGLRNFTNESAENLGTKLRDGHESTIVEPAIARRNQRTGFYPTAPRVKKVSFMNSAPKRGWRLRGKSARRPANGAVIATVNGQGVL